MDGKNAIAVAFARALCSDINYPEHNPNATYGFVEPYVVEEIEN